MGRMPRNFSNTDQQIFHIFNRACGLENERPLENLGCREKLLQLILRATKLHNFDIISFQIEGNHYHIEGRSNPNPVSRQEVARRYQDYYGKEIPQHILDDETEFRRLVDRIASVSDFAGLFQGMFSRWYNREASRNGCPRRGSFWAGRFKCNELEMGDPVLACLEYIDLNCVKAGLSDSPADYPYGSHALWDQLEKHPCPEALCEVVGHSLEIAWRKRGPHIDIANPVVILAHVRDRSSLAARNVASKRSRGRHHYLDRRCRSGVRASRSEDAPCTLWDRDGVVGSVKFVHARLCELVTR
ncbi:MAG: hypothetical protein KAI66_22725 [Lentisphaeria bacterium]|nr:hypothetical protein [Lentisphaeria bacterium]